MLTKKIHPVAEVLHIRTAAHSGVFMRQRSLSGIAVYFLSMMMTIVSGKPGAWINGLM
ncbi:hypothetical protein [Undibacterium sp. WLHG33]|uniref:hypothetical protein n=1 Tax=Undibacterium sp. WLHG33 TaxID=3412482 RepID=UPI003C2FDFDC